MSLSYTNAPSSNFHASMLGFTFLAGTVWHPFRNFTLPTWRHFQFWLLFAGLCFGGFFLLLAWHRIFCGRIETPVKVHNGSDHFFVSHDFLGLWHFHLSGRLVRTAVNCNWLEETSELLLWCEEPIRCTRRRQTGLCRIWGWYFKTSDQS